MEKNGQLYNIVKIRTPVFRTRAPLFLLKKRKRTISGFTFSLNAKVRRGEIIKMYSTLTMCAIIHEFTVPCLLLNIGKIKKTHVLNTSWF